MKKNELLHLLTEETAALQTDILACAEGHDGGPMAERCAKISMMLQELDCREADAETVQVLHWLLQVVLSQWAGSPADTDGNNLPPEVLYC